MALIQRRVNFNETWQKISSTMDAVICLKKVTMKDWNERFTYPFQNRQNSSNVVCSACFQQWVTPWEGRVDW